MLPLGLGTPAFAVTGYSAAGNVNLRPQPNTRLSPLVTTVDGQQLDIICQTYGENVGGSSIWDYTTVNGSAGFLSDDFVNGTRFNAFDPRIPTCVRQWGSTAGTNNGAAGQCTWGALQQFDHFTGHYGGWWGNAKDWNTTAAQTGWTVVLDAEPDSIVVLQPGIQGADRTYGHVGWVESVENHSDGLYVRILEMNAGGGLGTYDERTVKDVLGMSYILAPFQ